MSTHSSSNNTRLLLNSYTSYLPSISLQTGVVNYGGARALSTQSEVSERQRDRHLFYKKLFLHPASTHSHGRALSRDILCLRFHIEADFSDTLIAFILVLGVCDGIRPSIYE
jgi:hypothetical protein